MALCCSRESLSSSLRSRSSLSRRMFSATAPLFFSRALPVLRGASPLAAERGARPGAKLGFALRLIGFLPAPARRAICSPDRRLRVVLFHKLVEGFLCRRSATGPPSWPL